MHSTFNDIPVSVRKKTVAVLKPLLADTADLYSQVKQAHWNVRGPGFIALHTLFDTVAGVVNVAGDDIAERIMQLGGEAAGTVRAAAKASRLAEYPLLRASGEEHVRAVAKALGAFTALARAGIDSTDEAGDAVTADLLTAITAGLDKQLWFVEAHLHSGK